MRFDRWFYSPLRAPKESDVDDGSGDSDVTPPKGKKQSSKENDDDDDDDDSDENDGDGDGNKSKPKYKDADVESAMSLYNALRDPELSTEIIETLAKKAGILDRDGDAKTSKRDTEKKLEGMITRSLKTKLGKEYEKFSDLVGPALDEAIQSLLEEKFGQQERETKVSSWEKEVDNFTDEFVITREIEDKMKDLMADAPPNTSRKGFDAQKYLRRMYKAACEELEVDEKPRKQSRSRRNSDINDVPDFVVRAAPKGRDVSLDEAVDAAMRGIRFK